MYNSINKKQILDSANKIIFTNDAEHTKARLIFFGFIILSIIALGVFQIQYMDSGSSSKETKNNYRERLMSFDTQIPMGMNIVPIEIANKEQLNAIIDDTAVVDLFLSSPEKNIGNKKIASRVRLIRAPKNPNVFAILCNREMTKTIMNYAGNFMVSVLNPDQAETSLVKTKKFMRIVSEN